MTSPQIDVRPQHRLGFARTLGLCLKGIRHRLFRSLLTMSVVVLAVAFFMNLLTESAIARSVAAGVRAETEVARRSAVATDLWFGKPSAFVLAARLVAADAPRHADFAGIVRWQPERVAALAESCRREGVLLGWLDGLDSGTRAMLVRRVRNEAVLAWLADEEHAKAFAEGVARIRSHRLPMSPETVRATVAAAPRTRAELEGFTQSWHAAVDRLGEGLRRHSGAASSEGVLGWIAGADAAGLDRLVSELSDCGFAGLFPRPLVQQIQGDIRLDRLRDAVTMALVSDAGRKAWRAQFLADQPLEEKLGMLDDERAAKVFDGRFTRAELAQVAGQADRDRVLTARETALRGKIDPAGGLLSSRQAFLVAISFVVCMVGIANAMLMAITERFREIATMKCLGATDGFILTQFLMEAGIQGAFGGLAGMLVGLLLALVQGSLAYGTHLLWYFPWLGAGVCAAICIGAGLLLATLASIYPSLKASRMAPMEAMRVE